MPTTAASSGPALRQKGINCVISWPATNTIPAVVAAQFSRVFFTALLTLHASVLEAFSLASHVVQAHCTTLLVSACQGL